MNTRVIYNFQAPAKKSGECLICRTDYVRGEDITIVVISNASRTQGVRNSYKQVMTAHIVCSDTNTLDEDMTHAYWLWMDRRNKSGIFHPSA